MARPLGPREVFPAGRSEISQRYVALETGVTVRVVEGGAPGDPAVVMLPGWCEASYAFRHAFDVLPRLGLRTIAVDLRGFGFSDKPRRRGAYTFERYAADLDALLDALSIERTVLVGHSMGGGLALRYGFRTPKRVAGAVLINPTGYVSLAPLQLLRVLPRSLLAAFGRRLVPRFLVGFFLRRLAFADASRLTERDVDEYWAATQQPNFVYAARAVLGEFDWRPLTPAESRTSAVPSLVILGDSDRLVRNRPDVIRGVADTTVAILAGGHCVHEERPDEVYSLIAEFARRARTA